MYRIAKGKRSAVVSVAGLFALPALPAFESIRTLLAHGGSGMTVAEPPLRPAGDEAPQDPASVLVLLVLGLQGMGTLFAFNTIITPLKYYELRFAASPFSSSFESMLSITFNAVALASIVAFQRLQHVIRLRTTIFATLACELVVFATLTVYTRSPLRRPADELHAFLEASSTASFTVTLCCTALAAAATGLLNGSVVAYCAMFPARYTQVALGGMAFAGLAVSVAGLATTVPTQNQLAAAAGAGARLLPRLAQLHAAIRRLGRPATRGHIPNTPWTCPTHRHMSTRGRKLCRTLLTVSPPLPGSERDAIAAAGARTR